MRKIKLKIETNILIMFHSVVKKEFENINLMFFLIYIYFRF